MCSKCNECNIYTQFLIWLFLFVGMMQFVEDPADDGYSSWQWSSSNSDLGTAVQNACGLETFLWLDNDIEDVPDIVASRDYDNIAAVGLAFSIVELAIGFAMHHCAKKKDGDGDKDDDVEG